MKRPAPLGLAVVAAAALVALARDGRADREDFVGSARCGSCHEAELKAWQRGPHARAGGLLGSGSDAACLSCHTTGDAPVGPVAERTVGCEACHGPGKGYAAPDIMANAVVARALGLRPLDKAEARSAACLACHRQRTRVRVVDLDAEWKRIGHGGDR